MIRSLRKYDCDNNEEVKGWFSLDAIAAMLVHRTKEKNVFWELDSFIMRNMSHNLLLFCTPTWRSYQVNENCFKSPESKMNSNCLEIKLVGADFKFKEKSHCADVLQRNSNLIIIFCRCSKTKAEKCSQY